MDHSISSSYRNDSFIARILRFHADHGSLAGRIIKRLTIIPTLVGASAFQTVGCTAAALCTLIMTAAFKIFHSLTRDVERGRIAVDDGLGLTKSLLQDAAVAPLVALTAFTGFIEPSLPERICNMLYLTNTLEQVTEP